MAIDQNNLWTGFQMPRRLAADTETLTNVTVAFPHNHLSAGWDDVGNSLRRALLSSTRSGLTAIKIEGVEHEFSSIKEWSKMPLT